MRCYPPVPMPPSGFPHPAHARSASLTFGLALALVAACSVSRAAATSGPAPRIPLLQIPEGVTLRAGQRFQVRWSVPEGEVEELEILLSIDGGRRFALRVSPEVDARAGRYLWRVPNLASSDVRLRIRYNLDGRELDGEPSPALVILAAKGAETPQGREAGDVSERDREPDLDCVPVHEGTWWTGVRALDLPGARDALSSASAHLSSNAGLPDTADTESDLTVGDERTIPVVIPRAAQGAECALGPTSSLLMRRYPLRN